MHQREVMEHGATTTATEFGNLPLWNLADLYDGPDSQALAGDLSRASREASEFRAAFEGRLATLGGDEFAAALRRYEALQDVLGRIGSYAGLLHAGNQTDPKIGQFYQTMLERTNDIGSNLLFFGLEINKLDDALLEEKLAGSADLRHFAPWLRDTRTYVPTSCRTISKSSCSRICVWRRRLEPPVRPDHGQAAISDRRKGVDLRRSAQSPVRSDPRQARGGGRRVARVLKDHADIFALITNTLVKDKETEDRWRHFARPISSRNLSNLVEDEVVDALIQAVKRAYPKLSHRYYSLKARWLGLERLEYWDRNAPLPDAEDRTFPGTRRQRSSCRLTGSSRRSWRRSASNSSSKAGSMRRRGRENRQALFRIRRCRARTPISC